MSSLILVAGPVRNVAGQINASTNGAVSPADGRLRGPDFAATVASVSWPDEATVGGRSVEAPPDHRFVVFTLNLSENPAAITPITTPPVSAKVVWDQSSVPLSLSGIDDQIVNGERSTSWPSGTDQFTVAVSNATHLVDLMISEGAVSQLFNLWTLQRSPPAPLVLYRDANLPTLSGTGGTSTTLALSNPSDGFTSSANVTVQSASLATSRRTAPAPSP